MRSPAIAKAKDEPTPIATFSAWIPTIQSAILIGQGAQIKLQAGEDAIPEVLKLAQNGRDRELFICVFEKAKSSHPRGV